MYFLFCGRRHAFIRHVVYCDVYNRGVSVSGRQRRDGGAKALKLRLSVRCFPLTDIRPPQASPYITEFGCGDEQCVAHEGRSQLYSTTLFWVWISQRYVRDMVRECSACDKYKSSSRGRFEYSELSLPGRGCVICAGVKVGGVETGWTGWHRVHATCDPRRRPRRAVNCTELLRRSISSRRPPHKHASATQSHSHEQRFSPVKLSRSHLEIPTARFRQKRRTFKFMVLYSYV